MARPESKDPYLGELVLDRYLVDRVSGEGAFSRVYHGRTRTGAEVAVKVLLDPDESVLSRFEREVQVLRSLDPSPHVAGYVDDGVSGRGDPVLVLEHVDGLTLRQVLGAHVRVPPRQAAAFLVGLCSALAELHRLGLVHRDVKPGNVMLTWDGTVKLIDFGIVRDAHGVLGLLERVDPLADRRVFQREIDTGILAGTFPYMAPEQFSDALLEDMAAGRTDTQSDVYGLGVILYELLTGGRPMRVEAPPEGLSAIGFETLIRRRLELGDRDVRPCDCGDPALASIVHKALRHDPALRQPDAGALRDELLGYLEHGLGVRPPDDPAMLEATVRDARPAAPGGSGDVGPDIFRRATAGLLHRAGEAVGGRVSDPAELDPGAGPEGAGHEDATRRRFAPGVRRQGTIRLWPGTGGDEADAVTAPSATRTDASPGRDTPPDRRRTRKIRR